jgi:hypothetical protein
MPDLIAKQANDERITREEMLNLIEQSQSTKHCWNCGSSDLVKLYSESLKICSECNTKIPWALDDGQKPLLTKTLKESTTDKILEERGKTYGEFSDFSKIWVKFLNEGKHLKDNQPEYIYSAYAMITHKLARILNGDPKYLDSWQDIASYAELVCKELRKD